ncbi:MAG: helix-turn-helix transcriptional regulator [Proteobacteria bacterium]|nr:helix-turn-helix transcriptional regulator [Pseudomonadota bacterium]
MAEDNNVAVVAKRSKLRRYREENLVSKAELSRKAGISPITLGRIEEGYPCRIDTKRKILNALGLIAKDKNLIFDEE